MEDAKEEKLEEPRFLFHGTFESVVPSIADGIDLARGRSPLDFNHGTNAFYLNPSFNDAKKWCEYKYSMSQEPRSDFTAVVVYNVFQKDLDGLDPHRTFNIADEEWCLVVNTYRQKPWNKKTRELMSKWEKMHWIAGPMGKKYNSSKYYERPNSRQLAVKSQDACNLFDCNIHGVVFLPMKANIT
jgi:hypothetical protein